MSNPTLFAKRVTVLHKNGYRTDYTHVTELRVNTSAPPEVGPTLLIKGETADAWGLCHLTMDSLPIIDLHMTIIDWYLPQDHPLRASKEGKRGKADNGEVSRPDARRKGI